jgi:hypothetical protein
MKHYGVELQINLLPAQSVFFSEILDKIICIHGVIKAVLVVHSALRIDEAGGSIGASYLQALSLSQNLATPGAGVERGFINLDLLLV